MLTDRIIGRVGADILAERLQKSRQADGSLPDSSALFRLDKLSPSQIAAVVREILANPDLSSRVDLRIPATLVEGYGLPEESLTQLNAGAVRNSGTDKEALLTANGNEHNLADTLGHVTALGAKELRGNESAWVDATCHVAGFAPTPDDKQVFRAALRGLISASDLSLNQLGDYCALIGEATNAQGLPIREAIGWALPCVGLPRDTSFFANSKTYGVAYLPWRKAFEKLISNRSPLLNKLAPNGQPIEIEDLRQRFIDNAENFQDDSVSSKINSFIEAPPGDILASRDLALLEWERDHVHLIFEKPRERQLGLAKATLQFFDLDYEDPDVLQSSWRKYLEDLVARERRADWNEEDETFFELHRRYLERDPKLHQRWERIIFGKSFECNDFLDGFVNVAYRLIAQAPDVAPGVNRFLRFTVTKGRTEWRERFNYEVGTYFSAMYAGLKELMGSKAQWRVERMGNSDLPDPLFNYAKFFQKEKALRGDKVKPNTSFSKAATQIKFEVELIDGNISVGKTQLLWSYKPDTIGLSLVEDMERLEKKGYINCTEVPRQLVSKKGGMQSVSLADTSTLEATFARDAGSLVPAPAKLKDFGAEVQTEIKQLTSEGRLTLDQADELLNKWGLFHSEYSQAINDFLNIGLHGEAVIKQADCFGEFLKSLAIHARGDVCRSRLVSKVLSAGTVKVLGEQAALIIPPWHPERLKALAVKSRRVASLVGYMLNSGKLLFGDRGIFIKEFSAELAHAYYPEIAVFQKNGAPILLSEISTLNGYSLFERPVPDGDSSQTDVDPASAAKQVRELLEKYIALQPHEASKLNVLLYNADASDLPLAIVRELSGLQTDLNFQCNISVRHRDAEKLRRVYSELVAKAGNDPDSPIINETSDNFISNLRISVAQPNSTSSASINGFRPFDIAFLHDVISRTATVEWIPVDWTNDRPNLEHVPSNWSYRSVSGENELKSTTFLTSPRQTSSGWAYVSAVASVARQADAPQGSQFLPARRISLQNEELMATLNDAHSLSEWVATYDELLDKRQLQANNINVVKYRRESTNGRNMIVSSTSELRLLGALTNRRIRELGINFTDEEYSAVVSRLKNDALSISGDVVLRAAKRGVSAGEMIGLVLSRYLIQNEFALINKSQNGKSFTAYFLLDDYADWLAQKENRIADILGISVEEHDDGPHINIAVVESKYVSASGLAEAKRSSHAQLKATLSTFRDALFGDPGRLDRDIWLSRLADLLLDANIPSGCSDLLERARAKIRDGDASISLRGYSQIYVHSTDASRSSGDSDQIQLDDIDAVESWQEIFGRSDLRALVEAYANNRNPLEIREKLGNGRPWTKVVPKIPAARIVWSNPLDSSAIIGSDIDDVEAVEPSSSVTVQADVISIPQAPEVLTVASQSDTGTHTPNPVGSSLSSLIHQKSTGLTDKDDERASWAEEISRKLKTALNGYGLQANVLGTRLTPNGCLVRLAGSDRLRVEDIEAKRTQLLTTHAINLVTVQPKPGEIAVTIAGDKRQAVSLWDLWSKRSLNRNSAGINTSFLLGTQEINGALLYLNLGSEFGGLSSHEPHSLVAGATGSGKSVLLQALLLDIAATNPKELAKIILIDPKMGVDYSALEDLPHMQEAIITTRERATEVLSSLVEEMERRYQLFAAARARDLTTYNSKMDSENKLPMLFLVHDEFADWMLDDGYKSAVGTAVQRLGVKARAAGIHLIFAAQRPDKDVMPMQLRENLGNRLILKVASEATSKIALDRPGAEMLLGKGHMAAKLNGEQGLVFSQAPYLSDEDISLAVNAIKADNER
ncbi:MAG: DNA translocase FtsK [Polynucleobacter sp.]|nr:DNA translocase FtsK [Polynucleobacter sp.]